MVKEIYYLLKRPFMAGGERIELPSSESKSDELTIIQNPQNIIPRHLAIALPFCAILEKTVRKMGLEPITYKNVICCGCLSLSYIYIIQYFFIKIK